MKKKDKIMNLPVSQTGNAEEINLKGYPLFPASEDIYSKYQKVEDISPEDISKLKDSIENEEITISSVMDSDNEISNSNLDVPGAELDDEQENVGNEDEENNYYSLGGDDHNDLEEDQGE